MKKENRNWIAWIALGVSGIAIIVSVIAICIACPHIPELGFDYQGVVVGVLTIITAAFANGITSTILLLVYLLSATIIAILYSKKVYDQEKREV